MDKFNVFPDKSISQNGPVSQMFIDLNIASFHGACRHVHELPYGYNSNRDDLMVLFKENMGTCTTKHAVIGTLAQEMALPVYKHVGIYAMTEEIVSGTRDLLARFRLPYIPMLHCFLVFENFRVDLTEGNANGKNRSIEEFLFVQQVPSAITAKDEYLLYRNALKETVLKRPEISGADIKHILHAREEGLNLLKSGVEKARFPSGSYN